MFSLNCKYTVFDTMENKDAIKKRYASLSEAEAAVRRLERKHKGSRFGRFIALPYFDGRKKLRRRDYFQSRIVYVGD